MPPGNDPKVDNNSNNLTEIYRVRIPQELKSKILDIPHISKISRAFFETVVRLHQAGILLEEYMALFHFFSQWYERMYHQNVEPQVIIEGISQASDRSFKKQKRRQRKRIRVSFYVEAESE